MISRAEADCRSRDYTLHFLTLTFLMMLDFALTWAGIHIYGVITEANPVMIWLFELPFELALTVRMTLVTVLVGMCIWIYNNGYKRFNVFINFCILSNVLVMYAHLEWITYVIERM